ncbi:hypothetical protein PoB_006246400, partial [Plakobranchus ocellatus]
PSSVMSVHVFPVSRYNQFRRGSSVLIRCIGRGYPGGIGGTVACESALRSAGTLLSRVRAPSSAHRPDGGP